MVERSVTPRWLSIAIAAAVAACIGTVVAHAVTVHTIRGLGLPEIGKAFPPLSGLSIANRWVSLDDSRPCHLVRFASEQCRFSKADDPAYRALESRLLAQGCDAAIVAPQRVLMPAGYTETSRRRLLAEADLGFLDRARLTRTPTTMVFDRRWRLVWRREGILDPADADVLSR